MRGMKGRAELQSGAVLLLVGAAGLVLLRLWGSSPTPTGTGTVFTAHGFVSSVAVGSASLASSYVAAVFW